MLAVAIVIGDHDMGRARFVHDDSGWKRVDDSGTAGREKSRHQNKCADFFI